MDNGRHNAIFSHPEVDDNLNEENWQKSLEISAPSGLPSPEQLSRPAETISAKADPDVTLKFGQIAPVESSASPTLASSPLPGVSAIKTTGDHLDRAALDVIDQSIEKLKQTGNLSDFYGEARNLTEANLNNSFNRKLGADDATSEGKA